MAEVTAVNPNEDPGVHGNMSKEHASRLKMNAKLEHSMGGMTTRDDPNDLGAPMIQGDPSEPQGPEDALGPGPKRGDYRDLVSPGWHPHEGGTPQLPNVENIGEVKGKKGGVDS
jgi:hypothetical protein